MTLKEKPSVGGNAEVPDPKGPGPIRISMSEGSEMERVIKLIGRQGASIGKAQSKTLLQFRRMAIGIIAVAIESFEDFVGERGIDEKLAFLVACISGFAQGAWISPDLIFQAQYMKATAVMKQDLELLARFHEVSIERNLRRTPNVAFAPDGSGPIYGKLNETAHPSCLQAVGDVLATLEGEISVLPVRKDQIEYVLVYWHIWICAGFAEAAGQLLSLLADSVPGSPHRSEILNANDLTMNHLTLLAKKISEEAPASGS